MGNKDIKFRKLPKKTVIFLVIMSIIMILGFIFVQETKSLKMEEILYKLGHKNVSNVLVVNRLSAEDKVTKVPSTVYKLTFTDLDLNKECTGFITRSNDGKKYKEDFNCEKGK